MLGTFPLRFSAKAVFLKEIGFKIRSDYKVGVNGWLMHQQLPCPNEFLSLALRTGYALAGPAWRYVCISDCMYSWLCFSATQIRASESVEKH